ncbi:hypothetical protein [Rhizobium ruizarguesonis]|uniref:hypothetical protein n=1 Tax=Rhizobium ruizarguesonis TaxID=2081791 RepID=UPI0010317840|nr:hypothetical protein [Rhizobium ruizarguesonis]TBD19869.1 hypothetical protein ELH23_02405 [Rhizobium ruizarguesonis]
MADLTLQLLAEMINARPPGIRAWSPGKRRAYDSEAKRAQRARDKACIAAGGLPANEQNISQVLADAALLILRDDLPGADCIRAIISGAFVDAPDLVASIDADIRSGKRKLKRVKAVQF